MTDTGSATERRATTATVGVLLGLVAWPILAVATVTVAAYHWLWVCALLVFGVGWLMSRAAIGDIAERRRSDVDEYEADRRDRARDLGYLLALAAAVTLYILFSVAVQLADRGHPFLLDQAHQLVLVAFLVPAATPSFLLAWRSRREPDPDDD